MQEGDCSRRGSREKPGEEAEEALTPPPPVSWDPRATGLAGRN